MDTNELVREDVKAEKASTDKTVFGTKIIEAKTATAKLKEELARAIGKHIRDSEVTQVELAARTGLAATELSNIANGKVSNRSLNLLLALADYLGILGKVEVTLANQHTHKAS